MCEADELPLELQNHLLQIRHCSLSTFHLVPRSTADPKTHFDDALRIMNPAITAISSAKTLC